MFAGLNLKVSKHEVVDGQSVLDISVVPFDARALRDSIGQVSGTMHLVISNVVDLPVGAVLRCELRTARGGAKWAA